LLHLPPIFSLLENWQRLSALASTLDSTWGTMMPCVCSALNWPLAGLADSFFQLYEAISSLKELLHIAC
ncbi:hypothetical protein Q2354_27200, partial [Escherichia coli]|nr:hypothetical protein [Escherichia coli]